MDINTDFSQGSPILSTIYQNRSSQDKIVDQIHRSVMAFVDTYNALNTFKYIGIGMSCRKISSQDRQWSDISGIDHDIAIRVVVWHLYLLYLR